MKKYTAVIEYDRNRLDEDCSITPEIERKSAVYDLEAESKTEAIATAVFRLLTYEPNIEQVNIKVKKLNWPGE